MFVWYSRYINCTFRKHTLEFFWIQLHALFRNYRYLYFKDTEIYYQTYPPFYTNIGGYLFGIIAADIYIKSKRNNNLNKYKGLLKYELLWWLILPTCFALLFIGGIFTSYSFEKPSLWISLYAGLYKNCWAIICCLALLGMCFKLGCKYYVGCNVRGAEMTIDSFLMKNFF